MHNDLAKFARAGYPNGSDLPTWTTVAANGGKVMSFATLLVLGKRSIDPVLEPVAVT
jgi:carboxylesterase type B